jgi:hypothetical protein
LGLTDIFRPFVGYKEVRLVSKESRHVSLQDIVIIMIVIILYIILVCAESIFRTLMDSLVAKMCSLGEIH